MKFIKNLDMKSIVTILLTVALIALVFINPCTEIITLFTAVTTAVFTYYFSRSKGEASDTEESE